MELLLSQIAARLGFAIAAAFMIAVGPATLKALDTDGPIVALRVTVGAVAVIINDLNPVL